MQRRTTACLALLTLSAVLGACGSGGSTGPAVKGSTTSSGTTTHVRPATLNGSGSTFQEPFDGEVIAHFKGAQPNVTVNYAGGGSGKGKQDLAGGVVDFAGSDSVIKTADGSDGSATTLYFPTVAAPITVSYNVGGVRALRLSPDTIAGIFERKIKTWSASKIASDNPGVKLPSTPITVIHRSDGSGTTSNFATYLTLAAPTTWTLGSGDTVAWPSDTIGGNGNSGVAQAVKTTNGAIGYVDFSDAKAAGLVFASVRNKSGSFVAPSLAGVSQALAAVTVKPDLTYSPLDQAGAAVYPIATPTWILVSKAQTDKAKSAALMAFLTYIYGEGQKIAPGIDYAPLPASMVRMAIAQIGTLSVP